eukprot:XP_002941947.2 PREDICTED: uncharacterized protein LOC100492685 [Xenopus tropicalis]
MPNCTRQSFYYEFLNLDVSHCIFFPLTLNILFSPPPGAPLSIIIPVAIGLILFACIILLLFPNTRVLKRIVRAMGTKKDNKSSSLVDAKTEQGVTQDQEKLLPSPSSYATIVERNKGQPYGNNCPTQDATGPIQVQDDNLPFPIKETQTPETEEP